MRDFVAGLDALPPVEKDAVLALVDPSTLRRIDDSGPLEWLPFEVNLELTHAVMSALSSDRAEHFSPGRRHGEVAAIRRLVLHQRPGVHAYSEAAFRSLERACRDRNIELEGARALDFGCGTGLLSQKLSERCASIVALDSSTKMIEACRAKKARLGLHRVRPLLGNLTPGFVAENEEFESPFDLVVCSSVCAFLDDYPASVALLARQLRPGGLFVQWDWERDPDAEEPFGLSRDEIRAALGGAGLADVSIDTAFTLAVDEESMSPLIGVGISPIGG